MKDMFCNVNILPNLIYHYDSRLSNNSDYLNLIENNIGIDNDTIQNGEEDYTLDTSVGEVVLFRNSDGELKRRHPIVDEEYNKSQFVYVPQGYTTNSNLENAFTFRYNLPQQVDLSLTILHEQGINEWSQGSYGKEHSPELHPEKWPYYTQYFFTVDESINWNRLYSMRSPFISDEKDVQFYENTSANGRLETRVLMTPDQSYTNRWWKENVNTKDVFTTWNIHIRGELNVFLNLCGKRDIQTGKISDSGCLISYALRNYIKLDSFISGILTAFLNGLVFEDRVDAGSLTTLYAGDNIIKYYGFGRNIIFPTLYINSGGVNKTSKQILGYDSSSARFYSNMFKDESKSNYVSLYKDLDIISEDKYIVHS
jgi:hypothetical protein